MKEIQFSTNVVYKSLAMMILLRLSSNTYLSWSEIAGCVILSILTKIHNVTKI